MSVDDFHDDDESRQCPAVLRHWTGDSDSCCKFEYGDESPEAHRYSRSHVAWCGNVSWLGPAYKDCQFTVRHQGRLDFHCLSERHHHGPHRIGTGEYYPNHSDREGGYTLKLPPDAIEARKRFLITKDMEEVESGE